MQWPSAMFSPARMAQEVFLAEALAERRLHAGLEVKEHHTGHVLAARGLVVKHVAAAEVRIIVAAVLAAAADAVLVAHHLQKLCAVYLIVVPRPFPAAALVVRRRYVIVVPRPISAAPRIYLVVVYRPLPAAPLVVRCSVLV